MDRTAHLTTDARARRLARRRARWLRTAARRASDAAHALDAARDQLVTPEVRAELAADATHLHALAQRYLLTAAALELGERVA